MTLDDLAAGKYISLTTFKRDGTPVATPVWMARDGESLLVITGAETGKAKRLRNSTRVQVAPCDMRGTITGSTADAQAELLDEVGTREAQRLIDAKYGVMTKLVGIRATFGRLLGRQPAPRVGIRITLA